MLDLLIFVPACFALNLAFGPNNLLALTHAAQRGIAFAVWAGIGRLLVFIPMIALSALGLGVVLSASSLVFTLVKVLGAAYLIWLGWKLWKSSYKMKPGDLSQAAMSLRGAFRREGLVAVGNPKAILIFAAFFPQFVQVDSYFESYAFLGAVFLLLEAIAISLYAALGALAARAAASKLHWFQRASGLGMMLFGGLLLLTRRPA
ncbi:LysE family translocator [Denitrobaculum tricleocarpae]|uniref:LysE family translocator n=1 Tax=Denitrobaculum tricleocarpae TaxID=2591009 RepID=A0A545TGL3_9PROT|nr:LysE family translocator [Denitrobaculum tricleocarpae]TQV76338.1 LysE family translocator [Denitrobaculum tricleocarpae]